jgi:chromosomal replication initiator protein
MSKEGKRVWEEVLNCLKGKIKEENFSTWLAPTEGEKVVQNTLWVKVPNSFFVDWIESRYREKIYETIRELGYNELKIKYKVSGKKEREKVSKFYYENSSNLQPRYTFDNFIVGESNKFAHAASLAVARNPGRQFNPLFIYGGVGLGKTHLLQGIGNYIKEYFSHLKIY